MKITVSINTLVDVDGKKVPHPINEISLEVRMKTTVKELKGEIFRKTQIPIGNQVLETSGILLDQDNITLANCLIRDGDTVSVTVKDGILNSANSGQMSFDKKPDIDMGGVMGDIVEHDDDDMDMVDFGTFPTAPTATGAAAPTFIPGSKSFFPEAPKLFEKKGSVPSIVDDERDSNDSTAELQPSFTQTQPPQVHKDERCSCKCGKSECECGSHSGDDGEEEEDFDKMMAEIKEENAKKIQSMSQSEIDSALKEIYSALPANVIESMKKKAAAEVSQSHPQVHKDEHCSCKCGKSECECGSHGGGDGEEEEEEEEDFDKMMAEIKEENAKKIQSMSQSEIDSALKEIYSALPANVIESMKKKAAAEMPQPSKTAEKQSASVKQAERAREWPKKAESRSANNNTGILAHISTASKDSPEAVKAANEVIDVLNAIYKRDSARARKAPNPLAEWNADAEPPAVVPDVRDVETADIRFGFDGAIIPPGTDIPTSAGLHHHGGDQWAAGYTINELCVLMRSSFPSQRVEALRIVENILTRARNREYDRTDVRVVMVQKFRVPYLIRIAMDDKQVSVISAAVNTLHALVVDPRELQLEQIMEACYRGDEHQDYTAYTRKDPATADSSDDDDSDEPYVPDEDYAALDLLNGLLSLNTAERLRYLLQVAPLDGLEIPIVEIIDRLAHYSAAACAKVVETPFMIDALVERVLGLKENPALALLSAQTLRHLCQSTSDCCCRVVTNELFSKVFSNYFEAAGKLAVLPEHIGVQEEILAIYRAAARFGCLKDKLPKIPADFVGPIPATLSFLSACCKESSPYDEVSAEYALKAARILNSFAEMRAAKLSVVDLKTLSAVLHFLAIFIGNPSNSALCESALFAPLMRFLSSPYMSLITLEVFKKLRFDESKVDLLFFYRCLVDCGLPRVVDGRNDDANISTDANSTPTYDDNDFAAFGVHCLSGSVLSGLFFSFVRIFESCRSEDFLERVRYALDEKTPILVSISASIPPASPLNKLSVNSNKIAVNVLLCRMGVDPMRYYNSVLWTVGDLFSGDEAYLGELLSILFDNEAMTALASKEPIVDPTSHIESVRDAYISLISGAAGDKRLDASFGLIERGTASIDSLFISRDWYLFPLGRDWPVECLKWRITLAGATQKSGPKPISDKNSSVWSLQYLYWLVLNHIPYVGNSLWFHRCLCFFLLDEFPSYKDTLAKLFHALMSEDSDVTPSAVAAAGGSSYQALVREVLAKYGNESFGDPTFTQYIGFLALAYGPAGIRCAVWEEVPYLFHFLGESASMPWGLDAYLWPAERDEHVLEAMKRALASGDVSKSKTGLFYWVAVHHIACSLFGLCGVDVPATAFSKRIVLEMLSQKPQALVDVVEYDPPPPLVAYKPTAQRYKPQKGQNFDFVSFFEAKKPKNSLFAVDSTSIAHPERLSDLDATTLEGLFKK